MIIYIAGAYRADTPEGIKANIQKAREVALEVWKAGHTAICPHLNTANFEEYADLSHERYIQGDLEIISRCDAVLLMDNWQTSRGAKQEKAYAESRGIPVYNTLLDIKVPLYLPTKDLAYFWTYYFECLNKARELASGSKNSDYNSGKVNILDYWVFGAKSVFHMVHQKCLRLKSLLTSGNKPQNEKLEDSCVDLINYTAFLYAQLMLEKDKNG